MTVEKLYRNRMSAAAFLAVVAVLAAGGGVLMKDPLLIGLAVVLGVLVVMTVRMARESYRFDRGLAGPPEWRALVRDADAWAKNGYRTPEEIAAGVPSRDRPPAERSR